MGDKLKKEGIEFTQLDNLKFKITLIGDHSTRILKGGYKR
jgi:hypothetical protein